MRKRTIFAIVGPSGSGKSELSRYMEPFGLVPIVSFTTRPMRPGELDGREHWFVSEDQMPPRDKMLACAYFGGHHYWASINQVPASHPSSYIIDEKALVEMMERFKDELNIIPVYIRRKELEAIEVERRKRDDDRLILPDEFYAAVIENDGTLCEFLRKSEKVISELYHGI